jgi:hypothetical protein
LYSDQEGKIEIRNSKIEVNLQNNYLSGLVEPKNSEYIFLWDEENSKFILQQVASSLNVKKSEKPKKEKKIIGITKQASPPRKFVQKLTIETTIPPVMKTPEKLVKLEDFKSPTPLFAPKFLGSDEEDSDSESEEDSDSE